MILVHLYYEKGKCFVDYSWMILVVIFVLAAITTYGFYCNVAEERKEISKDISDENNS